MPFQPVPNAAQVEVIGQYFGEGVENTLFYEYPTQPTQAQLQALVDAVAPVVSTEWLIRLPADWVGVQVYARGLTLQADVQATNVSILGDPGTFASPGLPGNVTLAIKRQSGLTGRSSRGRIYWMGLGESMVTGNTISSSVALDIAGALDDTDAAAVALGWTPVIVSRQQNGVVPANAMTTPISGWTVEDFNLDSQRRRLAGRGT